MRHPPSPACLPPRRYPRMTAIEIDQRAVAFLGEKLPGLQVHLNTPTLTVSAFTSAYASAYASASPAASTSSSTTAYAFTSASLPACRPGHFHFNSYLNPPVKIIKNTPPPPPKCPKNHSFFISLFSAFFHSFLGPAHGRVGGRLAADGGRTRYAPDAPLAVPMHHMHPTPVGAPILYILSYTHTHTPHTHAFRRASANHRQPAVLHRVSGVSIAPLPSHPPYHPCPFV